MRTKTLLCILATVATISCSSVENRPSSIDQELPVEGQCDPTCCSNCCPASPIIIDLNGDGLDLTDVSGGVLFRINPSGARQRIGWTSTTSNDAWLALDRNDNGLIDDGGELFGNFTEQPLTPRPNGFLALAVFDKNADDFIDNADAIFSRLRLWQDTNHDGASQLNELTTLNRAGFLQLA